MMRPDSRNADACRGLAVLIYLSAWFITVILLIALIVVMALNSGSCSEVAMYSGSANSTIYIPENGLVLAFFGDQGLKQRSKDVLRLVRQENTSMVFHLGDFDYAHSPDRWIRHIYNELSSTPGLVKNPDNLTVDYFAVAGNHDVEEMDLYVRYSKKIRSWLHPKAAETCCEGKVGIRAVCTCRGIAFLQIGHGSACSKDNGAEWVKRELARLGDRYVWKFCLFHVVQHKMQIEEKGDGQGWEVYEACRRGGAIIASAHAHVYARTHLMSRFKDPQEIVHTDQSLRVEPGRSFAFVSGLAGHSMRPALKKRLKDPWWASVLHPGSAQAGFGVLFFRIGYRGDPREALVYFKTTQGNVIDLFHVQVGNSTI